MDWKSERDRRRLYLENELRIRYGTDVDVWYDVRIERWCCMVERRTLAPKIESLADESRSQGDKRILSGWFSELGD